MLAPRGLHCIWYRLNMVHGRWIGSVCRIVLSQIHYGEKKNYFFPIKFCVLFALNLGVKKSQIDSRENKCRHSMDKKTTEKSMWRSAKQRMLQRNSSRAHSQMPIMVIQFIQPIVRILSQITTKTPPPPLLLQLFCRKQTKKSVIPVFRKWFSRFRMSHQVGDEQKEINIEQMHCFVSEAMANASQIHPKSQNSWQPLAR